MNKESIIKTISNEHLSTPELSELLWLLNKDQYKEKPVSIEEFYSSSDFVAKKWPNIFPLWKKTLKELFPTPFNAPYNEVLISAAAGSGKCHAKGTKILMYDGTIKNVEDITVGEQLMGPDSKPRTVLSLARGIEQMYEIQPTKGGESWGCNSSHILSLKYKNNNKENIVNISVKEYLNKPDTFKKHTMLYRTAVDFPNKPILKIDPYIYGTMIADYNNCTNTNKHIALEYKTATTQQRLQLLAGIIDKCANKKLNSNVWEIICNQQELAQDYAFIARSLGCNVSVEQLTDDNCYKILIHGDLRNCPITITTKKANKEFSDTDLLKTNFNIIDKGIGEYYGFTLSGDHLYLLGDFTVTHNTVTATISILYDLYKLGCLKDPCSFYGLTPDTMIIMAIFSATASTAAVNWNDITTGIESCDWMMRKLVDKRGLEKKNGSITPVEILKGLYIQTGSKFQHSMGKAIFDGLMDEAAFGGANSKDAQKSYSELSSRIKTRFTNWGNKGNIPGHLFLISSPKEAGDFMQERIEIAQQSNSKLTKVMQNIATWEADPRKDSDDKFTVFIGNENKEPCMYDPDEDVPIEEMDYLIYPPMRYYEDFKKDLLISIMNYGGITTTSDMALFKSPTALNEVFVLNNPIQKDVIELPFAKTEKQLMDFIDMDYFRNIRHPEYNRFIHLDAAFSTNTLDVYGLAAGYCTLTDTTTFTNDAEVLEDVDVFTKKDRTYFIDFVVGITAPKGQEVPLYKVQDFIEYLIKNLGYPVACISADTFQSKQTLQTLQTKGFNTENVSVDRSRDPYLFLRHLIYNKQILLPKNDYLKLELRKLRDDGKKVDHPVNSHKDLGDAVAGCIWNCANSNDIINKTKVTGQIMGGGQTYTPTQTNSLELMEFERIKQQYSTMFKGL